MTARRYSTPLAFEQALQHRLKDESTSGIDLARRRQLLVFDRFLARLVSVVGDTVVLEGGLVLELRLARARTTKDIDLRMQGAPDETLDRLQEAARLDLGDFMRFEVPSDPRHPEIRNEGMKYDGHRFRAECRLAGKICVLPSTGRSDSAPPMRFPRPWLRLPRHGADRTRRWWRPTCSPGERSPTCIVPLPHFSTPCSGAA